jgi:poly [ADP-ribose] polymerase
MLWHGTKNKNIMSILLKGLKIKPPNATHTGSLFGDAIYFADKFTKSLDYTSRPQRYRKKEGNTFYMLLCEVALGNIANFTESWKDETYRPPKDHHSIRVMGKEGPDFYHSIMTPDYQVYPVGPIVVYPKVQFEKGTKLYGGKQFFAEYLRKKKEQLLKDAAEEVAKA